MDNQKVKDFFTSFGFWMFVGSIAIVVAIIFGSTAYQKSVISADEAKTSREVALTCTTDMATQFHIHPHLSIVINGVDQKIPANIGITSVCMNSIHTHDDSGTLHIEAPVKKDFTIGDFFAVWDKQFNKNQVLDYKADSTHIVTISVNDKLVDTFENTVINDVDKIVIEYKTQKN